jgi:hypothetical protein
MIHVRAEVWPPGKDVRSNVRIAVTTSGTEQGVPTEFDLDQPTNFTGKPISGVGLWLWSCFGERRKHLACGRYIFFVHEEVIISAVIPDCCENTCGEKRTLQNFHFDLGCTLKQHEFIVLGQGQKASRSGSIFFAHKQPVSQAAPCQMIPHATSSIRLNHHIDT